MGSTPVAVTWSRKCFHIQVTSQKVLLTPPPYQISTQLSISNSMHLFSAFLLTVFMWISYFCWCQHSEKNSRKVTFSITFIGTKMFCKFLANFNWTKPFLRKYLSRKKNSCEDFNNFSQILVNTRKALLWKSAEKLIFTKTVS